MTAAATGFLPRFQEAALLAKSGDRQGAIAAYDRLAASSSVAREYRDLAVLLAVMHQLSGRRFASRDRAARAVDRERESVARRPRST